MKTADMNCPSKGFISAALLMIGSLSIFVPIVAAQEIAPSFGVLGGASRMHVNDASPPGGGSPVDTRLTFINVLAFFDLRYVVFEIGYRTQLGPSSTKGGYVDDEQAFLVAAVLARYPIILTEFLQIFPLLGLEGSLLVAGDRRERNYLGPVSIQCGGGADFRISKNMFLRICGALAINFSQGIQPGPERSAFNANAQSGFGFTF